MNGYRYELQRPTIDYKIVPILGDAGVPPRPSGKYSESNQFVMNIGFLCSWSPKTDPPGGFSISVLNRATLIDSALRQFGRRLFVYSPKHLLPASHEVPGYLLERGRFVAAWSEVPIVNGNWTHHTRALLEEGMGYRRFVEWAEEHQIGIYVPLAFTDLVLDKYETFKLVRGFREDLHPYCERYRRSVKQIEYFAETGRLTFLKPRGGNKGNGIITMTRDDGALWLTYYERGMCRRTAARSVSAANELIERLTAGRRYIVERGIETLPYEHCVFDIRVVMTHDGCGWDWMHEARLSPRGSDLSNVSQGGSSLVTEDLLFDVLGYEAAGQMLDELASESFGLAAYLERLHPGDVMEVAFDFVLDDESRLRLVEINTKPGLAGIGYERPVYDKLPEHEPLFERWVYPHTSRIARFLARKHEQLD